jgi:hypothetical protein
MKSAMTFVFSLLLAQNVLAAKRIINDNDAVAEVKSPRIASTGNEMRSKRRIGLGIQAIGSLGLGGLIAEFNFTDRSGMVLGFGGGSPNFQAWTVQYKKVLAGESILPYVAAGFAKWNNFEPKPGLNDSTPGILTERLMSDADKRDGVINEYLLYPAAGVQYVQLDGDWAGFSVFAEFDVLFDVVDFVAAPTGAIGTSYYF